MFWPLNFKKNSVKKLMWNRDLNEVIYFHIFKRLQQFKNKKINFYEIFIATLTTKECRMS